MTIDAFITQLSVQLNMRFTDEQLDFEKNLDTPGICFASPGTGKTASAVAGLLVTELFKQIPGENIYALSFTNMATLELSVRHKEACDKLGVHQRVNFKTLHSLCSTILRENYRLLGMERLDTTQTTPIESLANIVLGICRDYNIDLEPRRVRSVIRAIRTLNSALVFEQENVESKACFKDTGLSYENFQLIRWMLYDFNKKLEKIQVDDILLYTLELMLSHPEVSIEFKKKCRVLLVDEAQDLSLLQLRIITLLSDCPVLIGDIKQQIYAFNGACQEIVEQFYKYFPGAWRKYFTRSFRCKNEIANFATKLIIPNHVGGEDFTGIGSGGVVQFMKGIDYEAICKKIFDDYLDNKRNFPKGILFLFRNNYSAIPLAETFFKMRCPFRVNRYVPVSDMPVIRDLCAITDLAQSAASIEELPSLALLIPEFRHYDRISDNPFYKIMMQKHCSIFDISYAFRDAYNGERVMGMLLHVHDLCLQGAKCSDIFNAIYPLYYEYYLSAREKYMEYDAKYYMNMANYAFRGKGYQEFRKNELEKSKFIRECNEKRVGVRCYTFHSAKGLEDDIVYLLSCDEGIIPNKNKLKEMQMKKCDMDLAREIRNERSLVYVACTRARDELYIHFDEELSSMLTERNDYAQYDLLYESFKPNYKDVEVFQEFYQRDYSV